MVRGPDWDHGDEDGGEGHVGTVVKVHHTSDGSAAAGGSSREEAGINSEEASESEPARRDRVHSVTVQWDCGHRGVYKCGMDGKFELRIFDSAQTGEGLVYSRSSILILKLRFSKCTLKIGRDHGSLVRSGVCVCVCFAVQGLPSGVLRVMAVGVPQ